MKNMEATYKKEIRDLESKLATQALNNPQRPPGGLLAQGKSSKDASSSHQAFAVILRSGLELEDPYMDMVNDEGPCEEHVKEYEDIEEPILTPTMELKDDDKEKDEIDGSSSLDKQPKKGEDGFVEDVPYEKEVSKEADDERVVVQPRAKAKVTKKTPTPKVSLDSQLVVSNIPYPSRALKTKENFKFTKFQKMIDGLEVTLPFTEVILNMPTYAKFLKDILTNKRTLGTQDVMVMGAECSALLIKPKSFKMPKKLGDPGSFLIPCVIGDVPISRALCDNGASVSVIPLTIARKIGLDKLTHTSMTLQLADRSEKQPLGVLEDIPVQVGKFLIPTDFVVLDTPEDSHTPIILGRPFLATGGAIIDIRDGRLTFRVEGEILEFNLPHLVKGPMIYKAHSIEIMESIDKVVDKAHEVNDEKGKKVEDLPPPNCVNDKCGELLGYEHCHENGVLDSSFVVEDEKGKKNLELEGGKDEPKFPPPELDSYTTTSPKMKPKIEKKKPKRWRKKQKGKVKFAPKVDEEEALVHDKKSLEEEVARKWLEVDNGKSGIHEELSEHGSSCGWRVKIVGKERRGCLDGDPG